MNTSFTGKGLPAPWSPKAFRSCASQTVSGRRSQESLPPSSASRSVKTSACLKQQPHGKKLPGTHSRQINISGLILLYKTQAERLAGPPLQATRMTRKHVGRLNTSMKPVVANICPVKYQQTKPAKPLKTSAKSRYTKPASATTTSSNGKLSKIKVSIWKTVRPLENLFQTSLIKDEHGQNFWHNLGSAMALVMFFLMMLWILTLDPIASDNHPDTSTPVIYDDGDDK